MVTFFATWVKKSGAVSYWTKKYILKELKMRTAATKVRGRFLGNTLYLSGQSGPPSEARWAQGEGRGRGERARLCENVTAVWGRTHHGEVEGQTRDRS